MLVLDTETTGIIKSRLLPLAQQPEIIELAVVKLDEKMREVAVFSELIKPKILPLSADTTKITGITTEMVADKLPFSRHLNTLVELFLGERVLIAHNIEYDVSVTAFELARLGRERRFPWPQEHVDTVELTMDIEAKRQASARLKLSELYEAAMQKPMGAKHRALDDVKALVSIIRVLRAKDGRI